MRGAFTALFLGLALFAPAALHAAPAPAGHESDVAAVEPEGEHAAEPGAPGVFGIPQWALLTFNLIVLFGILGYFAGPAVIRFLEGKGEALRKSLDEAREQQRQVEAMAATLAAQVAELRQEVEELRQRAETDGERERQAILAEAERERGRVERQASEQIDRRLQQARRELTEHAVALAARLAEEQIAREITPEDRRRLFERNLARLEVK